MPWGQAFDEEAAALARRPISPMQAALAAAASGALPPGVVESDTQPVPGAVPVSDVFPNHPDAYPAGNAGITNAMRAPDPNVPQWAGVPPAGPAQGTGLQGGTPAAETAPEPSTFGENFAAGAKGFLMNRLFPGAQQGIDRMHAQRALVPYLDTLEGRLEHLQANPTPQNQLRRTQLAYLIAKTRADQTPAWMDPAAESRFETQRTLPDGRIETLTGRSQGGVLTPFEELTSLGIERAPDRTLRPALAPPGHPYAGEFVHMNPSDAEGLPTDTGVSAARAGAEDRVDDFAARLREQNLRSLYDELGGDAEAARLTLAMDKGKAYRDPTTRMPVYGGDLDRRKGEAHETAVSGFNNMTAALYGLMDSYEGYDDIQDTSVLLSATEAVKGGLGIGHPAVRFYKAQMLNLASRLAAALEGGKLTNQDIERQLKRMPTLAEAIRDGKLTETARLKMAGLQADLEAVQLAKFRGKDKEKARIRVRGAAEEEAARQYRAKHGKNPTDEFYDRLNFGAPEKGHVPRTTNPKWSEPSFDDVNEAALNEYIDQMLMGR